MAKQKLLDRVQSIGVYVVETGADSGGYTKFPTTIGANEHVGIEIRKVSYNLVEIETTTSQACSIAMALGQIATNFPEPESNNSLIGYPTGTLDKVVFNFAGDITAPGDASFVNHTVERDFSDLPLLAHPAALYAQIIGARNAAAAKGTIHIHFNYVNLTDAEFMDLLQGYIVQNAI